MRRSVYVFLAIAIATALFAAPARAFAQTNNDQEVRTLIDSVFESEYTKKQYVEALEKLQLASNVCQEGACSSKVRAKLLVAVGTVLAGGLDQTSDAKEVFKTAIKEDKGAALLKGYDTGKVKDVWESAHGAAKPKPVENARKKYPGNTRPPRGWRTGEASWDADQAEQAEKAGGWGDCAGYAGDSFAIEKRTSTLNLKASCEDRGGKLVEALADFQAVADQAPKDNLRDLAKSASDKVTELTGKMPKLVLQPPPKVDDLQVQIDDVPVAADKLGGDIWANPGQHRVTATGKDGGVEVSFEQDVSVDQGKSETVELKLLPKESRIADTAIMQCMAKAKSRAELAKCIGGDSAEKSPVHVSFSTEIGGYHDTDHVDVLTPGIGFTIENPVSGWSVTGGFLVDVVTAASTDIVATASPRWTEVRYAPSASGSKKFGDVTLGLNSSGSVEPDYVSVAGGASFAVDLKEKTITPQLAYEFSYDISGRAGTPFSTYSHKIIRNGIDAGVSLVLDKASVLNLGATLSLENGDTSKPYRYVPMFDAKDAPNVLPGLTIGAVNEFRLNEKVLEQLPTTRQRLALDGRLAHRFSGVTYRMEERLYVDSWGLKASTTDITLPIDAGKHFRFWPHFRGHIQTGVDFWKLAYVATETKASDGTITGIAVPALRTGNRELGPLAAVTGGAGGRIMVSDTFALTFAADVIYTRFLDDLYILQRVGFFGSLGAELSFE